MTERAPATAVTAPIEAVAKSEDGEKELFLRHGDLWLRGPSGEPEKLLVEGRGKNCLPSRDDASCFVLGDFHNIEFHPDGKRALFSVSPGRGEEIISVELETAKLRRLAWAFGHEHVLIRKGPNKGHLLLANGFTQSGVWRCMLVDGVTGRGIRDVDDAAPGCYATPEVRKLLGF